MEKEILLGEGADELFGSYSYMQRAPTALLLHQEVLRRLKLLHQYDVLRCDRLIFLFLIKREYS